MPSPCVRASRIRRYGRSRSTKPSPGLRFKRGDTLQVTLGNELPVPAILNWHGIEGVPAAEALAARPPLAPGATENLTIPLRHAGTLLGDFRLLGDGQARPSRALPLIVGESEPVAVDRDEVFLIEDWRLRPDGTAITPGSDPKDTVPIYTVNGRTALDVPVRTNERLRIRFINGFQRNVIAIKIEKSRGSRHGPGRPAERTLFGAQWYARAGAGNPGRCFR